MGEWVESESGWVDATRMPLILLWLVLAGRPIGVKMCACGEHGAVLLGIFPEVMVQHGVQFVVEWPFGTEDHSKYENAWLS